MDGTQVVARMSAATCGTSGSIETPVPAYRYAHAGYVVALRLSHNKKRLPVTRQPLWNLSNAQADQALALVSAARSERSA